MGRYKAVSKIPGWNAIVGWDNGSQTFFALICESKELLAPNDEPDIQMIVGHKPNEDCLNLGCLLNQTDKYLTVPPHIKECLLSDFKNRSDPTPTQKLTNTFFRELY